MDHHVLDARNLLCPIPVIRTQTRINALQHGDHLAVICTDPGSLSDIPAWCRIHGHKVLQAEQDDEEIRIVLQVCKA